MLKSGLETNKTSASGAFAPVSLFFAVDEPLLSTPLKGAALFCACLQNPFDHSFGYALHEFHKHSSKKGHAETMKLIGPEPKCHDEYGLSKINNSKL